MSYVVCVCINRINFTSLCMARLDWYKALHYLCFRFQDLIGMSVTRNSKIQRYKEQKELEKKLHDLRDVVEQETVDDEVKVRFYYKFCGFEPCSEHSVRCQVLHQRVRCFSPGTLVFTHP